MSHHKSLFEPAIILAAGRGQRLGGAASGPKCLLELGGKSLLARQAQALAKSGVREIVVVVGFEQEKVRAACDALRKELPLRFSFIENPRFAQTNTIYSLYLAREYMTRGFYSLNGDVLLTDELISTLAASRHAAALAVLPGRCGEEEVKVITSQNDRIVRIGKKLPSSEVLGEYIGIGRFQRSVASHIADSLAYAVEQEGLYNHFYEYALDRIAMQVPLFPERIEGGGVLEIDFPEDLARAQSLCLGGYLMSAA